jgi:hypothetical protein
MDKVNVGTSYRILMFPGGMGHTTRASGDIDRMTQGEGTKAENGRSYGMRGSGG